MECFLHDFVIDYRHGFEAFLSGCRICYQLKSGDYGVWGGWEPGIIMEGREDRWRTMNDGTWGFARYRIHLLLHPPLVYLWTRKSLLLVWDSPSYVSWLSWFLWHCTDLEISTEAQWAPCIESWLHVSSRAVNSKTWNRIHAALQLTVTAHWCTTCRSLYVAVEMLPTCQHLLLSSCLLWFFCAV